MDKRVELLKHERGGENAEREKEKEGKKQNGGNLFCPEIKFFTDDKKLYESGYMSFNSIL